MVLRRETLSEQLTHHLLNSIQDQGLQPGAMLSSEAMLAKEFGVSRHVVREALRSLEARGIIEVANGKGAIIKPFSSSLMRAFLGQAMRFRPETLIELLEVRRGLEIQSITLAAQRRSDDDLARMTEVLSMMRQCLHDGEAITKLDADLHLLIARASGNSMLCHLIESIREPLQDSIRAGYSLCSTAEQDLMALVHEEFVIALRSGDAVEAGNLMARHFDGALMHLVHARAMATQNTPAARPEEATS
jgi:DNA-binding FadR family transcriptional regulator